LSLSSAVRLTVPRGIASIPGNHGPVRLPLSIEYNAGQPCKGGIVCEFISGAAVVEGMRTFYVFRHKKAPADAGAFELLI
jgi:hypothetical protein